MKKSIIAIMLATAGIAQAAEVGLSAGTDKKFGRDMIVASVGTSVAGLHTSVDVSRVQDTYHTFGMSVGKQFNVMGVNVLPYGSLAYLQADAPKLQNGGVGSAGLEFSIPLSKTLSVTADVGYRWDVKKSTDYEGTLVTFGIKGSF
jgi:hypothetical protein